MSTKLCTRLCFGAAILVAGLFLTIVVLAPVSSEERFREHHRDHDGGGGAGVGIGIELGTQLLQRRAKKPEAPGTGTVKTPGKKGDPPKKPPKKEKPKAPPPPEKPKEETDCVIYMQYHEKEAPEGAVAGNEDILNSAKALRKKLAQDAKKKEEDIPLVEVNSKTTLEQALAKISAKGKCCKTLHIVSHGTTDGELDLPYDLPDKNGELTKTDKDSGAQHKLGGPKAKTGWGSERLEEFVKALKKNCKTGTVVFDGCYAGKADGIAQQVAEQGIPTKGFPGYCELGPMVDEKTGKKEYSPPRPGKDEHQSDPLKSFDPKTPGAPKPEDEPEKK